MGYMPEHDNTTALVRRMTDVLQWLEKKISFLRT